MIPIEFNNFNYYLKQSSNNMKITLKITCDLQNSTGIIFTLGKKTEL